MTGFFVSPGQSPSARHLHLESRQHSLQCDDFGMSLVSAGFLNIYTRAQFDRGGRNLRIHLS